ncbi:MAG TPA: hypothetical protein VEI97_09800, partial [bacterium]|nr:hypothetical protein [bacterium]
FFGPKGNIRDALRETIFDTDARARYAVGQFTDQTIIASLAQKVNQGIDIRGVFDGFLTPNGQVIIDNAEGFPYFYPGFNTMSHQWYAADFPLAATEFQTPIPGRDPVLFLTTNPWTTRSFDSDDAVAVRVHDVSVAVRYGLLEFDSVFRATGIDPQTGRVSDPPTTVLVFGEVRSRSNNAPIEATVEITSAPVGIYLPGDGGAPITAETDPDTGQYAVLVPAGNLTVDVIEADGPYLLPPSDQEIGVRFQGGSAEVNFYLNLMPSGTSGGSGGG